MSYWNAHFSDNNTGDLGVWDTLYVRYELEDLGDVNISKIF